MFNNKASKSSLLLPRKKFKKQGEDLNSLLGVFSVFEIKGSVFVTPHLSVCLSVSLVNRTP